MDSIRQTLSRIWNEERQFKLDKMYELFIITHDKITVKLLYVTLFGIIFNVNAVNALFVIWMLLYCSLVFLI